jgi:hypothetical protein
MALEAPLRSSTERPMSAFAQHMTLSPDMSVKRMSSPLGSLGSRSPDPHQRVPSANGFRSPSPWPMPLLSPSDMVGPSPVTSNGTDFDEEASDAVEAENALIAASNGYGSQNNPRNNSSSPRSPPPQYQPTKKPTPPPVPAKRMTLATDVPDHVRRHPQESNSVVHAPQDFGQWKNGTSGSTVGSPNSRTSGSPGNVVSASPTVISPKSPEPKVAMDRPLPTPTRPTISTDIKPASRLDELDTPQAQVLTDMFEDGRLSVLSNPSLEIIDEARESDVEDGMRSMTGRSILSGSYFHHEVATPTQNQEIVALRTALQECWTLCNTLANLSYIHRRRVFKSSSTPDAHERAWKTCWRLCQELHENRDDNDEGLHVRISLDLCRDFCQALFDIRQRTDEIADSVLRVSFELNNHLYSAQDSRNLPDVFRERTLEFYITLCHRLMKQRAESADETDSLLRACWALAEMLFSLHQNRREGRPPEEELLVSAVQACWDLCDIFRDGWSQEVRPERTTPRPSTAGSFFTMVESEARSAVASPHQSLRSTRSSVRSGGSGTRARGVRKPPVMPPTPVTILDDTPMSPDSQSPAMPNIFVLGQAHQQTWSSTASDLSGYTRSSQRSRSTNNTNPQKHGVNHVREDPDIANVKTLVLRAAMDHGFSRDANNNTVAALQSFVNKLPSGSFGPQPAHAALLNNLKNLVLADKMFVGSARVPLPQPGRQVTGVDLSKSILWLAHHNPRLAFLRDLFTVVFCFPMEEAHTHGEQTVIHI